MIRGRISSLIEELNELSKIYNWIPNENTIRPSREDLEKKWETLHHIEQNWHSMKDYVYHNILNCTEKEWVFSPSIFRYNLPADANHWVLWNTRTDINAMIEDETINAVLCGLLDQTTDFAWYKNPKPSVPEYFHVQVFWSRGA
jgi:hypothetical protein